MSNIPLSERMRPTTLKEFVGQEQIIGKGKLLTRAIENGSIGSMIFYGPPGTGKTTLAYIIANTLDGEIRKLNAVSSGVADAKLIIEQAKKEKAMFGRQTYLLLDECHRWNKAQSDSVLQAIEEGSIVFIGSTTENPYTSMTRAIVSRCSVFEFLPLSEESIIQKLNECILDKEKGFGNIPLKISADAFKHFAWVSSGDLRMAYNALELAVSTTAFNKDKEIVIDKEVAENSIQKKALSLDSTGYYDMLSAFCKSIRGSDTDAALYYFQRMVLAGVDPMIIARRLAIHTSEDIGMADSNAMLLASNAMYILEKTGSPEGLIPLTHAIIYACEAEKSNSVITAMNMAKKDAEELKDDNVPFHLKNHPSTLDIKKTKYLYPHNFGGYVKQQYMPDKLKDKIYYVPSKNGKEKNLKRKKFL